MTQAGVGWPIPGRPLLIGRGPSNELQLTDEAVSTRHAAVWADAAGAWIEDLKSRNGVRVNGTPIRGITPLHDGDEVQIGGVVLRVVAPAVQPAAAHPTLVLEHLGTGLRIVFGGARFRLGEDPGADLHLDGVPDAALIRIGSEIVCATDDETVVVELHRPFHLGPHTLRLSPPTGPVERTREVENHPALTLVARLDAHPFARVEDDAGHSLTLSAENRAALLWVLGRKLGDDRAAGVTPPLAGWLSEVETIRSVWGRGGATGANLRVLIARVRKELREAGLDPWMIEHHGGRLRLLVAVADVR